MPRGRKSWGIVSHRRCMGINLPNQTCSLSPNFCTNPRQIRLSLALQTFIDPVSILTSPSSPVDPFLQPFNPTSEAFHDIPNMSHFVKFNLQLINLAEDLPEACDLRVCCRHRSASARRLRRCRDLCLRGELWESAD